MVLNPFKPIVPRPSAALCAYTLALVLGVILFINVSPLDKSVVPIPINLVHVVDRSRQPGPTPTAFRRHIQEFIQGGSASSVYAPPPWRWREETPTSFFNGTCEDGLCEPPAINELMAGDIVVIDSVLMFRESDDIEDALLVSAQ